MKIININDDLVLNFDNTFKEMHIETRQPSYRTAYAETFALIIDGKTVFESDEKEVKKAFDKILKQLA